MANRKQPDRMILVRDVVYKRLIKLCIVLSLSTLILSYLTINNFVDKRKSIPELSTKVDGDASIDDTFSVIPYYTSGRVAKAAVFIKSVQPTISSKDAMTLATVEYYESKRTGIPYEVGLAVSWTESTFSSEVNTWCCVGIKGINYYAHKDEYNIKSWASLYNINRNVTISYKMLDKYISQYGNIHSALKRYYGSTSDIDNRMYADKVLKRASIIKQQIS